MLHFRRLCMVRLCVVAMAMLAELPGTASTGLWKAAHRGDVRAELTVPSSLSKQLLSATIVWRRRDANPAQKRVLVTDSNDNEISSHVAVIEQHQGVVLFTPPSPGTYYVYWLPYTQTGTGHIDFRWDAPTEPNGAWVDVATWTATKAATKPQIFNVPAGGGAVTGDTFRVQFVDTYGGFQAFVRELAIQATTTTTTTTAPAWLPNRATPTNPAPLSGSSGWQSNHAGSGGVWCAMDGNATTIWDPTVNSDSWLELSYPTPITVAALSVLVEGDGTHDAKTVVLQSLNKSGSPAPRYPNDWQKLPALAASSVVLQPRNAFESFEPMGLSASVNETAAVVAAHANAKYIVFTEDRSNPVRMQDRLPYTWVERHTAAAEAVMKPTFEGSIIRGEYYTFQIAVFVPASQTPLSNIGVSFSGFPADVAASMTCFNSGGVSAQGTPFSSEISVAPSEINALWIGFELPADGGHAVGSTIAGVVTIAPGSGIASTDVAVALSVSDAPAIVDPAIMDSNPANYTRMRWLNSNLAQDDDVVTPFTPITIGAGGTTNDDGVGGKGNGRGAPDSALLELGILNRVVKVAANGFLQSIVVTRQASIHGVLPEKSVELIASGGSSGPGGASARRTGGGGGGMMSVSIYLPGETTPISLTPTSAAAPTVTRHGAGKVSWWAESTSAANKEQTVVANVSMSLELDGYIDAQVHLSVISASPQAHSSLALANVVIAQTLSSQHGMAWMGMDGESEPVNSNVTDTHWKWSMSKRSSAVWVGSAEAGLRFHLKGASLDWDSPAVGPETPTPVEWGGGPSSVGGCNVTANHATGEVTIAAYTGPTTLNISSSGSDRRGSDSSSTSTSGSLDLHFDMSVTPFKTANQSQHWSLRHYQVGYPSSGFTSAAEVHNAGANVINIHQGVDTMINPYINYPFVPESVDLLANYTAEANALGMRVKYYYTVRELSTHASEIWALRMLGDEIYKTDANCGYDTGVECAGTAWQRLHLGGNFTEAWVCPLSDGEYDAAIAQQGLAGRWLNYYIEGLRQSVAAAPHIDGIYFDGILFGRATMQRARKVLERYSSQPAEGGLIDFHTGNDFQYQNRDIVDAVVYMNHWAYVDSLWIGEGFSYDSPPVYWLTEISGLAFGLFSDMLGTPNQYRGMLFGSTGRPGCAAPKPMWQFWDAFGINQTDMVGWWQSEAPVVVRGGGGGCGDGNPFTGGNQEVVLVTSYVIPGVKTLVAVASWAPAAVDVQLQYNWTMLGLDHAKVKTIVAPPIGNFQEGASWPIDKAFTVPPAKGFLLVLEA